jgi:hypothetical protein
MARDDLRRRTGCKARQRLLRSGERQAHAPFSLRLPVCVFPRESASKQSLWSEPDQVCQLCPMPFCTMSAPVNVGKFARLVAGGMVGGVLVPVIFYPLALWSESARREKKLERERQQQQT